MHQSLTSSLRRFRRTTMWAKRYLLLWMHKPFKMTLRTFSVQVLNGAVLPPPNNYVMAWRRGQTNFLQSALTRAIFFSALLTGTAFGSLWLSSNPGMSSMGKLLALSLACTLTSAVLFQPALVGEPRSKDKSSTA